MNFNSHAHVEHDVLHKISALGSFLYFNSHAHVEHDAYDNYFSSWLLDFNSHAHVEHDFLPYLSIGYGVISTHTLTWSMTIISTL